VKIAIATDWFAPRRGGIEAQLAQLATALSRRGHQVDVITSTPGAGDHVGDGFRVRRLDTRVLPKAHVAMTPAIVGAIRGELQRGYDVVHAHVSVVSPVGYAAAGVARSLGLPSVVTFHSVLRHKRLLLRLTNAVANLSSSAVVWTAVSDLVASQVRSALVGAEVTVLSNGIDIDFWSSGRALAPPRQADEEIILISTMRLHRKKRPRQLIAAFAQATTRAIRPVRLCIVGDGPERGAIRRDIRALRLDQGIARVELLGWLPAEEVRAIYAVADGFVLASVRESFGVAALEAVVAGLPVIAMAGAGCREFLVGQAGSVLCQDDAHLTETIARFIAAPEARVRSERPSSQLERYHWPAVAADHEGAYARAINRASAVAATVGA
jgi:glycosyltransferase involved in cell wall biosynthesis